MAAISVGSVSVDVVPSVKDFARKLRRDLVPEANQVGKEIGETLREGIRRGLGDPLAGPLEDSARKQERKAPRRGDQVAGAFAKAFQRRLKAAFESLPKANIDADATPADEKITELRARLEALSSKTVGIDVDAADALAEIAAVQAELEQVGAEDPRVDVRANVAAALTQLGAVQAEVDALDGRDIDISVSKRSLGSLSGAASSVFNLSTAMVGLAPVALPALSAVAVGAGGLAAALTGAGIAAGGFALIALPMFKKVQDAQKKAASAMTAFNKATTDKGREAAMKRMQAAVAGLTPAEKRLNTAVDGLEKTWKRFNARVQPDVIRGLLPWIGALKVGMGALEPVIGPASDAIELLGRRAKAALTSPYWQQWFRIMGVEGAGALMVFGQSLGNVAHGLSSLLLRFVPAGRQLEAVLLELTDRFNAWATSAQATQSIQHLISYVQTNGPLMGAALAEIARSLVEVLHAIAPLAPVVLGFVTALAQLVGWVARVHPGLLQTAYAVFFLTKAYKLIGGPILAAVKAGELLIAAFRGQATAAAVAEVASVRYGRGLKALGAAAIGAEAATVSTKGALLGLTAILARVGVVLAVSPLVGKLENHLLGTAQSTQELTRAMIALGQSGKFSGALVDEFKAKLVTARTSVQVFKNDAKELVDPNPIEYFNHAMSQMLSFLPGVDSTVGRLRDKFKSLDTTLTGMVQAGQTQQAAAAFAQLRAQLTQAGLKTDQINRLFPQYTAAVRTAATTNNQLSQAIQASNAALEGSYQPSIAAFNAVTRLKQGYGELITALRTAKGGFSGNTLASYQLRQAFTAQLDSVVDLYQATLKKTGSDVQAKAAVQAQLPILYALAGRNSQAAAQVDALARATGTSTSKQNVARGAFLGVASSMGISRARAEALWREYTHMPSATDRAASGVEHFAVRTHAAIHDLKGKNLNVTVFADGKFRHATTAGLAAGGPVRGPGGPTADKVPLMGSAGEHMWTARETSAVGGHAAMYRLRQAALAGQLRGYAAGGAVDFTSRVPTNAKVQSIVAKYGYEHMRLTRAGQAAYEEALSLAAVWKKYAVSGGSVVQAARSQIGLPYSWGGGGRGGPSYGIGRGAHTFGFDCSGLTEFAWWRGKRVSIGGTTGPQHLMSRSISGPAPGALGFPHAGHVMLGSNKPGYVIQAPHTGGHVEEVRRSAGDWRWPKGASTTAGLARGGPVLPVEMSLGKAFERTRSKAVIVEAKVLQMAGDPAGILPASEWHRLDSGGYLPVGPSLVYNGTGSPEPVLTGRQFDSLHASAAAGGGRTVNVMPDATVHVHDGADVDMLAQRQEFAARSASF